MPDGDRVLQEAMQVLAALQDERLQVALLAKVGSPEVVQEWPRLPEWFY